MEIVMSVLFSATITILISEWYYKKMYEELSNAIEELQNTTNEFYQEFIDRISKH